MMDVNTVETSISNLNDAIQKHRELKATLSAQATATKAELQSIAKELKELGIDPKNLEEEIQKTEIELEELLAEAEGFLEKLEKFEY